MLKQLLKMALTTSTPATKTEPKADDRVSVCESRVADAEAVLASVRAELVAAQKVEADACRALEGAERAYAENPTSDRLVALLHAREHLPRLHAPVGVADQREADASHALKVAIDALAAAHEEERVAAVRVRASVETFNGATRAAFARLLAALDTAVAAAREIDAAFADATAAAIEVGERPLGTEHLLVEFLAREAEAGRAGLFGDAELLAFRAVVAPSDRRPEAGTLAAALGPILVALGSPAANRESTSAQAERAHELVNAIRATRTFADAVARAADAALARGDEDEVRRREADAVARRIARAAAMSPSPVRYGGFGPGAGATPRSL